MAALIAAPARAAVEGPAMARWPAGAVGSEEAWLNQAEGRGPALPVLGLGRRPHTALPPRSRPRNCASPGTSSTVDVDRNWSSRTPSRDQRPAPDLRNATEP